MTDAMEVVQMWAQPNTSLIITVSLGFIQVLATILASGLSGPNKPELTLQLIEHSNPVLNDPNVTGAIYCGKSLPSGIQKFVLKIINTGRSEAIVRGDNQWTQVGFGKKARLECLRLKDAPDLVAPVMILSSDNSVVLVKDFSLKPGEGILFEVSVLDTIEGPSFVVRGADIRERISFGTVR